MIDNDVGIILLVYNEEIHLKRCLDNLLLLTSNIYVVDSYSNDNTLDILNEYGIHYVQNKFLNQSHQLNFAIKNYPFNTNWILRVDCDELLTLELINEIKKSNLLNIKSNISIKLEYSYFLLMSFLSINISFAQLAIGDQTPNLVLSSNNNAI